MNSIKNDSNEAKESLDPDDNSSYVTVSELLREKKETLKTETIDENRQETSEQTIKERETIRIGREKYFGLRDKWSWFIFSYICFMLLFQLFLTVAIGYNWVDFSQYKTFLHVVMAENFAQIIGMGYIVAKYLFPNS